MRAHLLALTLLVALVACDTERKPVDTDIIPEDTAPDVVDADGDGFPEGEDCDDDDPAIHPGADEHCDGVDEDCDGQIDDEPVDVATWYADGDGDGYGDLEASVEACEAPTGFVDDSSDCDDADDAVHPEAGEICNGIDDDCDELIDDEDEVLDPATWYADGDGDGYGDAESSTEACELPSGFVDDSSDCDDTDDAVHPEADEICNGIDDDCDELIDDEDEVLDPATWYADGDGDGYGDAESSAEACELPSGFVADDSDCDDGDATIHPGATETCNGVDDDCDGVADEGLSYSTWYADGDGDGYGDPTTGVLECAQPTGFVADASDCDDGDGAINPGAAESCNGADDDCDGDVDEGVTSTWYVDGDGDGYGDPASPVEACAATSGTVADGSDCDDGDAAINPGAVESCNGADDDCDGDVDEGVASTWYVDGDGDGYGDPASPVEACTATSGTVADSSDCDDGDGAINPGASEVCDDGVDDDCDGVADDGCPTTTDHCGTISSDETWAAGTVHRVTCDVYVQGSSRPTLTIQDGVEVLFDPNTALLVGSGSYGSLEVEGVLSGVLMTSSESAPTVGDWDGVTFGSYDQGSVLEGLTVEYGGGNGYGNLYLYYAEPEITGCTVQHSSGAGIWVVGATGPEISDTLITGNAAGGLYAASGAVRLTASPSFTGNTVTGNADHPVVIPAAFAHAFDASSSFSGNTDDTILLVGDVVDDDATWQALDVPWQVEDIVYVQGSTRPTLILEDGVEVRFDNGAGLLVGSGSYGSMEVEATTAGVLLTSSGASPSHGDWEGVAFGSYDQGSVLEGVTIEYAGANGFGAIYSHYADLEITGCTIEASATSGIFATGAEIEVSGTTILDCQEDGVSIDASSMFAPGGSPSFTGNTITGCAGYPVLAPANTLGALADDNLLTGNSEDYVFVRGDVVDDSATWRALSVPYYVDTDVYVQGSTTPELTLEDGVELYFNGNAGLLVGTGSYGELEVLGSSALGVLMSSEDDPGSPGAWDGVSIGSYGDAIIEGLTLEYGGDNGYGGLYIYYADVEILDSAFGENEDAGIFMTGGSLEISDSMLYDNEGIGLEMNASSVLGAPFSGNVVSGNGDHPVEIPALYVAALDASSSYSGNGTDVVMVLADTVDDDGTWQALDVPYQIEGDIYVQGSARPELSIEAGCELRFDRNAGLLVGSGSYGALEVLGTSSDPVLFTSSDSSPMAGDWDGITLGSYCTDASTNIEQAWIEYGGDNGYGNIYSYYCSGSITDSEVTDSSNWGIYVVGTAPSISGVSYSGNASGDLYN
jgi:hypothetical protein